MVPLAGLIDTAFLGHLDDIRYLNGVALATVIFNVIYWSFNFFRMGTTGPTAQAVGRASEGQPIEGQSVKDQPMKDRPMQGHFGSTAEVWLIVLRNSPPL